MMQIKWFHHYQTNNWIWVDGNIELEVVRQGKDHIVYITDKHIGKTVTLKRGNRQAKWSSPQYAQRKAIQYGLNPEWRAEVFKT